MSWIFFSLLAVYVTKQFERGTPIELKNTVFKKNSVMPREKLAYAFLELTNLLVSSLQKHSEASQGELPWAY